MFSKQTPDLVRQLQGHLPDEAVRALEQLLGNAAARLEHRAPVVFDMDGTRAGSSDPLRGGPLPRDCSGTAVASLLAANQAGRFSGKDCLADCVDNGLAFRAVGPSHLDVARIDTLYVGELLDDCGDPLLAETPAGDSNSVAICRFVVTNTSPVTGDTRFALGKRVVWNGSQYTTLPQEIGLRDFTPTRELSSRWRVGCHGYAARMGDRLDTALFGASIPTYEVVCVESPSRYIEFRLQSDMVNGVGSAIITRSWGATSNFRQSAGAVFVYDRLGKIPKARQGYVGTAVYDEQAGRYIILADDDFGVPQPPDSLIRCVQVNGPRLENCLYSGVEVTAQNLGAVCAGKVFSDTAAVWISFPNFDTDVPPGTYHFARKESDAYTVQGDTRPLYVSTYSPSDWAVVKVTAGDMIAGNCLFPATLIGHDYSLSGVTGSGCDIVEQSMADVDLLIPAFGDCPKVPEDRVFLARKLGPGIYLAIEGYPDHCSQVSLIAYLNTDMDCSGQGARVTFIDSPGVHPHVTEDDAFIGISGDVGNPFRLCGVAPTAEVWTINSESTLPLTAQISRSCMDTMTSFGPSGRCSVSAGFSRLPLQKCSGEAGSRQLDLSGVICGCDCGGQGCECPATGQRVLCTIEFTGEKQCAPGVQVTEQWVVELAWNPAQARYVGEVSITFPQPIKLYSAVYHCGNDPPASQSGWVSFYCNNPDAAVSGLYDLDELPLGAACFLDGFDFGGVVSERCSACTLVYRITYQCFGVTVAADGSYQVDADATITALGWDGEPVGDTQSVGPVISSACRSATLGVFDSEFSQAGSGTFEFHYFAGFSFPGRGTMSFVW
jgi:hypothetical protein